MQVDEATVRRIARLARIKITEAEAKGLKTELSGILNWVEQLDEVDTSSVEPLTRVVPIELRQRQDKVTDGEIADEMPVFDGIGAIPKTRTQGDNPGQVTSRGEYRYVETDTELRELFFLLLRDVL